MKLTSRQFFTASAAALAFGLAFVGVAQIITPEEAAERNNKLKTNTKQLATGLILYAYDYDDSTTPARDWSKNIIPYVKYQNLFSNPWRPGVKNAFGLNKAYIGIKLSSIGDVSRFAVVFPSSTSFTKAAGGKDDLWKPTKSAVGAIGFADGHVEGYLRPIEVKADWSLKPKSAPKKAAVKKQSKP